MKRHLLLISIMAFAISITNAQTENEQPASKRNVLKFYPTSLIFGKATIGYERVINENSSFTFNLGLPSGINPLDYAPDLPSDDFSLDNGKVSGMLFMPGYRFNFSKKGAPFGFYIEPYLKYESFTLDFDSEFTFDNESYPTSFDGDYSAYGGGVQMGVQCLIANVITLEWSFLGLEVKSASSSITITDNNGTIPINELFDEIEGNFTDIPLIGSSLEFEKGAHSVGAKASNFLIPGARFAFSIGIAF
ncbi:MAG: hypothetical protein PF484_08845 [Bacteroidales bacterium]|nr:hypothetical protein [Bacteroidales bacterium]